MSAAAARPMRNEGEFISPVADPPLLFRRLHAREALGRLPEYSLELLRPSRASHLEPQALLGQKATVRIEIEDGVQRHVNGVVTRFEQGGMLGRFDIYHVELRPWLFHLTLSADCRIFQDKTAIEILDQVFHDYDPAPVDKRMAGSFRKRPYTVQYRESDFNFVSRLMEEEGLYYYFRHEKDRHTLVLCNGPGGHAPLATGTLHWAARQTDDVLREDIVTAWSRTTTLQPEKFTHLDHAADAPSADLRGEASRSSPYPGPREREVFDYPGGFEDLAMDRRIAAKQQEATRLARLRVDAFESGHVTASGITPHRPMAAGATFTFADHADAGGYLVTRADYRLEFTGYEAKPDSIGNRFTCRFDAVPREINFQPPPIAVRPVIHGPQTATVVGPAGDEIHTDRHGRVRLHFHWDRAGGKDEKSSCWTRVSQAAAGKGFGAMSLPRIGEEVLVEFLEGNPDRPLVTGRVYNADHMPPWELPRRAAVSGVTTRSTKHGGAADGNELRFDDTRGSEHLWMTATRDYYQDVRNDASRFVAGSAYTTVGKLMQTTVNDRLWLDVANEARFHYGGDHFVTVRGDHVGAIEGALGLRVAGAMAVRGADSLAVTTGAGADVSVGAALRLTATAAIDLQGLGIVIDGGTQVTIRAGGSFITVGPDGVSIQGALVNINAGGAAGTAQPAVQARPPMPRKPGPIPERSDPLAP